MEKMATVFVLLLLVSLHWEVAKGDTFSIRIDEYEKACFGYDFKDGSGEVSVEIQVSRGGDTDISWKLLDPNGIEMVSENRINMASYDFNVTIEGTYQICLDNSFTSQYKVVTVGVEHELADEMQGLLSKIIVNEQNFPKEIKEKWEGLMKNAEKLIQFHEIHAAKQKRHSFLVGSNLSRVNGFSLLSCFIMIVVGVLQVFVVKGLFEDGSKRTFKFW